MRPVVYDTIISQRYLRPAVKTHRGVVVLDVLGRAELREDVLREDLAELDTHLVYSGVHHHIESTQG